MHSPGAPLVIATDKGLFCPDGGFYIDPWGECDRAVITHAHGDHARRGAASRVLAAESARTLLEARLPDAAREYLPYGVETTLGGVKVSLHPAGHVLGSAQVRIERGGEVWVVSGDYKLTADPTCAPFEPIRCDVFVSESTFGLPLFRWPDPASVSEDLAAWWAQNRAEGRASIVYAYALGKAQRVLAGLSAAGATGPVFTHGAVERLVRAYRDAGVALPETRPASSVSGKGAFAGALIVAPPSAHGTPWMRRFGDASTAFCSGWMRIRGLRRRRAVDRGFVLSDHADWPELLRAIDSTGAPRVLVTHGSVAPMVRHLREKGLDADSLETPWHGERAEAEPHLDKDSEGEGEGENQAAGDTPGGES